jgi:hypothetical protein
MSSVLRAPSQIPVRAKYLIVDVSANPGSSPSTGEAFTIDANKALPADNRTVILDSVLNASGADKIATKYDLGHGHLYRDLGRQVVVVDVYSNHLAHFRAAQLVSGPASEGVPANYDTDVYICVWSAAAGQVAVSRTG